METIHPTLVSSDKNPNTHCFTLPKWAGEGGSTIESFSSGVRLMLMDMQLKHPVTTLGNSAFCQTGIGFCLAGQATPIANGCPLALRINPAVSSHFIYPEVIDIGEKIAAGHYLRVNILLSPVVLHDLVRDDEALFAPFLNGLTENVPQIIQHSPTHAMRCILQQILECPYRGKTRSLFLEGKIFELLAHKLTQIRQKHTGHAKSQTVKRGDRERILHATDLLIRDLENPPALSALSQAVGLSRSKLHRCFQQVHGSTPLEYLRDYRLAMARKLLAQGSHNVTEAAYAVGYNSLSYFSKIFKARYSLPPHEVAP